MGQHKGHQTSPVTNLANIETYKVLEIPSVGKRDILHSERQVSQHGSCSAASKEIWIHIAGPARSNATHLPRQKLKQPVTQTKPVT